MSDQADIPPLPDETIVYRAARSRSWIDPDNGGLLPIAFELRPGEPGASVSYNCSIDIARTSLTTCYGVAELEVGAIRRGDARLDVIPDTLDHAEIRGLPRKDEEPELNEYLTDILSRLSRLIWQGKHVAPKA
jgi:hypothetical protein